MRLVERLAQDVRRCGPGDRAALVAFQEAMFGPEARQCRADYAAWLFERNPHRGADGLDLWILERGGEVVGQQAAMPVQIQAGGSALSGEWAIDLIVRPEWRMRGAGPALSAAQQASTGLSLALGVSEPAYKAFLSAGWSDLGRLPFFVRPLDAARLAAGRTLPAWAETLAGVVPRAALEGAAWAAARILGPLGGTHLEPLEAFDERADEVWRSARTRHALLAVRDLPWLRWRYDDPVHRQRYRRWLLVRRGRPVAWAVTRLERWNELPVGRVVDYLCPRGLLLPLFASAVDALRREGAVAVFHEALDEAAEQLLPALGFVRGPSQTRFMLHAQPDSPISGLQLARPERWFVTSGDADLELRGGG